jgi:hypothetical protein
MAFKLGFDGKVYRQTSGTRAAWPGSGAAPNLDLVDNIRDVTINLTKTEADVTVRGGNGWRQVVAALKEGNVEFEMVYDTADADFTAFIASFTGNTTIALAILDGVAATVGTQGLWADFMIIGFEKAEPLEGAMTVKFTAKPTYSSVAPAWVTTA